MSTYKKGEFVKYVNNHDDAGLKNYAKEEISTRCGDSVDLYKEWNLANPESILKRPQVGGANKLPGCKLNTATSRCHGYDGPDKMGCTKAPTGRCRLTTALQKAYTPKRQATPAQLAACKTAREAKAAKAIKAARQAGGCRGTCM
jgi:hypothetical protein